MDATALIVPTSVGKAAFLAPAPRAAGMGEDALRPARPIALDARHAALDRRQAAARETASARDVPSALTRERLAFEALSRPGPSLAFQAQLYAQAETPLSAPPAYATTAYQMTAAARTGFLGLLDPLDLWV